MSGPPLLPQLTEQMSIQSQIVDVSSPHVGSLRKAKSTHPAWQSAHACPSRLLSSMHPAHASSSDMQEAPLCACASHPV
jgi:hypothetical protein